MLLCFLKFVASFRALTKKGEPLKSQQKSKCCPGWLKRMAINVNLFLQVVMLYYSCDSPCHPLSCFDLGMMRLLGKGVARWRGGNGCLGGEGVMVVEVERG